jgi:hypothetical protein
MNLARVIKHKGRTVTVNVLALRREIDAGTLSAADRETVERMMPGICDAAQGKLPVDGRRIQSGAQAASLPHKAAP